MRLIRIQEYNEQTMQLAKPVYDGKRRILLAAGNTIHPKYLERLIDIGITNLIVEDAVSKGVTMEELLDMPTWLDVIDCVKSAYEAVRTGKPINLRDLLQKAGKLIDEASRRPIIVPVPSAMVADELKDYAHAVNVAIMSLQTGKQLGYNQLQLRDLVVGVLLHDIGKAKDKSKEAHPETGFQIIRAIREISLLSAHIAYQHHETLDGKGFPRQLAGKEIHEYAQVCAVADLYDHLIADEGTAPHEAMEVIMGQNGIKYSESVVSAFVKSIPAYPPGTKVRQLDGKEAIVTRIIDHLQRPCIRLLATGEELFLTDHPSVLITAG
ncbi:HD-GYP domain-containing protein [Cohnella suwonensis]|uniref:HD-GYP domain-containing protein n=1 Tax=Cohnella suwonensis TaxID=696072 RepID=A0ABW0M0N0_9BACL